MHRSTAELEQFVDALPQLPGEFWTELKVVPQRLTDLGGSTGTSPFPGTLVGMPPQLVTHRVIESVEGKCKRRDRH
jgi:hypothetical protein